MSVSFVQSRTSVPDTANADHGDCRTSKSPRVNVSKHHQGDRLPRGWSALGGVRGVNHPGHASRSHACSGGHILLEAVSARHIFLNTDTLALFMLNRCPFPLDQHPPTPNSALLETPEHHPDLQRTVFCFSERLKFHEIHHFKYLIGPNFQNRTRRTSLNKQ